MFRRSALLALAVSLVAISDAPATASLEDHPTVVTAFDAGPPDMLITTSFEFENTADMIDEFAVRPLPNGRETQEVVSIEPGSTQRLSPLTSNRYLRSSPAFGDFYKNRRVT